MQHEALLSSSCIPNVWTQPRNALLLSSIVSKGVLFPRNVPTHLPGQTSTDFYSMRNLWLWTTKIHCHYQEPFYTIPVGARFSAPVQTGPGAQPASCTMGTGSFPGVKSGRGVTLTPHPFLVPWSRKGRDTPLLPLWAVRPVQSLSACTRVHFTLPYLPFIMFKYVI